MWNPTAHGSHEDFDGAHRYSLAVVTRHRVGAFAPPDDRLRRVTQYSRASVMELEGCGVLDTPPSRSMTTFAIPVVCDHVNFF